ncbi:MAG: HTH-type transcriptional regulator CymR [candidate division BRC1 bacterium ADurb.BinA364]|nr:MAG: HTH-type transcriptional regulator CymR [candidate division BRC1 bacterium ADurb.BinA364]
MKLTTRARYALRAMLAISKMAEGNRLVSLGEVAERAHLPKRYLEQLAVSLKNASLLQSFSGRNGGYLPSRHSRDIKIRQIIEAAIGPISIVDCVSQPEICIQSAECAYRRMYALINRKINEAMDEFTLADLAAGTIEPIEPVGASWASGSCPARPVAPSP